MRPRTKISPGKIASLGRAMLAARNKPGLPRLQCLWLRIQGQLSTEAIAQTVGLSVSQVRRIWSDYLRGGLAGARGRPSGGRRHQNLTLTQERELLAPWQKGAQKGQLVTVQNIKLCYELRVRRVVPVSTVYRLLKRHQWQRVKATPTANVTLKRTSWCGWAPASVVASDI